MSRKNKAFAKHRVANSSRPRPRIHAAFKLCSTCGGAGIIPCNNDVLVASGEFCPTCRGAGRVNHQ